MYEIERELFGEVEKAALKVISIPQNASEIDEMYGDGHDEESITSIFKSHLKSIIAEYSMMRKLNDCTNIVRCDDVRYVQHDEDIGWDVYIKMELLTPLMKALPAEIPQETVIKAARDLCAALVLCRKHDIVHRDIKPQNIFISPNGEYKLGDFGIAKTMEKTMGGTKIGTYKYMAPEVYNNQPYGSAADIYSLGLVLYWMLNERRLPFMPMPPVKLTAEMDDQARKRRLAGERFPEPKHGSSQLKAIVMKACSYHVEDRYSSAAELLRDLDSLERGAVLREPAYPAEDPTRMQPLPRSGASVSREPREAPDSGPTERTKPEQRPGTQKPVSGERSPARMRSVEVKTETQSRQTPAAEVQPPKPIAPQAETGVDVYSEITIRTSQKNAGRQIPVDAAGKLVYIVLPGRVTDGQTIRYEGKGKRDPKTGKYGDLHLTVHVIEDSRKPAWLGTALIAAVAVVVLLCVVLLIWKNSGKSEGGNTVPGENSATQGQLAQNPQTEPQSGEEIRTEPESGETEQAHTHSWVEASCTGARYCSLCGQTSGEPLGHDWAEATCTAARYCRTCGQTSGEPLGHDWMEATYENPKTCRICAVTEGEPLRPEPKPLSEFAFSAVVGKIWTRGETPPEGSYDTRNDTNWDDWSRPGHTGGTVRDNVGNVYEHGIHIDGWDSGDYYFEIRLDGNYTTFSGTCACPERSAAISNLVYNTSRKCTKYFEVYGDGELLFTSATMRYDQAPQAFSIDVTGVEVLRIQYPPTKGPNEIATIYDGLLS